MLRPETIIQALGLQPHPTEGGYFVESYRSAGILSPGSQGGSYSGERSLSTAIYYLLTPDTVSALHRLATDEIFHFYLGDPVEMLQLHPEGESKLLVLGTDLEAGMRPQVLVPGGVWQGSRLLQGGRLALMGTTMSPGFDPADYDHGDFETLAAGWPEHRERIRGLLTA